MYPKKKILSLMLAAAALLTLPACQAGQSERPPKEAVCGVTDFSDMSYVHYKPSALKKLIQKEEASIQSGASDQVFSIFEDILTEWEWLQMNSQLITIKYNADITSDIYQSEYAHMENMAGLYSNQIIDLGKTILEDEKLGAQALAVWPKWLIDEINSYDVMTDEQISLDQTAADLLLDYERAISSEAASEEEIGKIFTDLVKTRQAIAKSYGYDSYTAYVYEKLYHRDYSPAQAADLSEVVKETLPKLAENLYLYSVGPLLSELDEKVRRMTIDDQLDLIQPYLGRIDPVLSDNFAFMEDHHLYDLEDRDNKLEGGYTLFLPYYDEPFIMNKPDGLFDDLFSLIHEFGHFNSFMMNQKDQDHRTNIDLSEVHSQGLEFLFLPDYREILTPSEADTATAYMVYDKLDAIIQGCLYDEFQQKVYALEEPTTDQINAIAASLYREYGVTDLYETQDTDWMYVIHNFENPFYYISYAVSAISSFEFWQASLAHYDGACDLYMDLTAKGEREAFLKTLEACGLSNPTDPELITKLYQTIADRFLWEPAS